MFPTVSSFYEIPRIYEENRKYRKEYGERAKERALRFVLSSISSMIAKHFKKEVGPLLSFCDPSLHEIIAEEEGILVTADRGLFENLKSDTSIKGEVVHVNNDGMNNSNINITKKIKELGFESEYILTIERLANSLIRHASVVQTLILLSMITDALQINEIIVKGKKEVKVSRKGMEHQSKVIANQYPC